MWRKRVGCTCSSTMCGGGKQLCSICSLSTFPHESQVSNFYNRVCVASTLSCRVIMPGHNFCYYINSKDSKWARIWKYDWKYHHSQCLLSWVTWGHQVTYTLDSLEDHRVPFVKQNLGPMYLSTHLALTHFTNFLVFLLSFLLLLITLSFMPRKRYRLLSLENFEDKLK